MDFLDKKQFFKAKSKTHVLQVLCFYKQKQTKVEICMEDAPGGFTTTDTPRPPALRGHFWKYEGGSVRPHFQNLPTNEIN